MCFAMLARRFLRQIVSAPRIEHTIRLYSLNAEKVSQATSSTTRRSVTLGLVSSLKVEELRLHGQSVNAGRLPKSGFDRAYWYAGAVRDA